MGGVAADAGGFLASFGWRSWLAVVWLALLAGTAIFLGLRLLQASRRGGGGEAAAKAEEARAIAALERSSQRMPLLDFVKRAGRQGWDVSGRSIEIMDLMQGLRRVCAAQRVQAWGRPNAGAGAPARTELHRPIPPQHWRAFEFDVDTIVGRDDNFDTRSCDLRQKDRHAGGFVDILIDRQAALDWLDGEAASLRRPARQ